jgi:hypothetical protein
MTLHEQMIIALDAKAGVTASYSSRRFDVSSILLNGRTSRQLWGLSTILRLRLLLCGARRPWVEYPRLFSAWLATVNRLTGHADPGGKRHCTAAVAAHRSLLHVECAFYDDRRERDNLSATDARNKCTVMAYKCTFLDSVPILCERKPTLGTITLASEGWVKENPRRSGGQVSIMNRASIRECGQSSMDAHEKSRRKIPPELLTADRRAKLSIAATKALRCDARTMEAPMRLLIMIAAAVVVIAIGYAVKATMFPSATANLLTAARPSATTLSPHEIHINYNYKAMKELPVHDSTNAN